MGDHCRVEHFKFIILRVGKIILMGVVGLLRYQKIIRIGGYGYGVLLCTFYMFSIYTNLIIKFYQIGQVGVSISSQ